MKQKKLIARMLSLVLTVAMVGTLLPTTALAAEGDTPAVTSGTIITPRTTSLDLKATSLSYVPSGGGTPKTADPTTTSITDTGEGWSWNHSTKTLTLSGATITNTETATPTTPETPNGLVCYLSCGMILPSGSTIELTENTENTITGGNVDTSRDLITGDVLLESAGVCVEERGGAGKTTLTIQGKGTLNAVGGTLTTGDAVNTSRRSTYSYGITSSDSLNIKGGTVNATGGDATANSNYPQVASYGINAWYDITVADAANVTATGGRAKGTFKVNRSGYADGFADSYGLDAGDNIVITGSTVNAIGGATENTNVDTTSTVEGDSGSTGISSGSSTTINGATVTSRAVYTGIETTENLTISNGSTVVAEGTYFGIAAQTALSIEDSTVTASGLDESGVLGFGISGPTILINSGHVIAQGTMLAMACIGEDGPGASTITIADSATIVGSEENDGTTSAAKIGTATVEIMERPLTLPCMVLTDTQAGAKDVDISFGSAFNTAVSFDARNGKPNVSVEIKDGVDTITMPADPTWGNYTFAGWWTEIDGKGGTAFANSGLTASTTVYAKWTKDGKTVRTTPLDLRDGYPETNKEEGWAWDNTNKTLTLSGAQIFGTGEGYGIMLPTNSKIVLSEGTTSNVTGGSEPCLLFNAGPNSLYGSCGIFCETVIGSEPPALDDGKLTITGKGKLVATGGDLSACTLEVAQVSSGIGSTIHITVEGADVTATGGRLSPYTNIDNEWVLMSAGMFAVGGIVEINGAAKVIATGAACDTYRDSFGIQGEIVTIKDSADVTAIAGEGETSKGIDSGEMTMTGGTLSASGEVAISATPITAAGATVTNGTADNEGGTFVSGTTNTLTQTDATQPVVIKFTNSVTFDARNGVAIKNADIDKNTNKITALPADPTWGDYTFAGWYTDKDGKGTAFENSNLTSNVTVYAKWTKDGKAVYTQPIDFSTAETDLSGDGYAWNNTGKTLTLNGAIIDCSGNTDTSEETFGIKLKSGGKILLTENTTSTVKAGNTTGAASNSYGVYFADGSENCTIGGKGTLNATGGNAVENNSGIASQTGTLTVSDATIVATSTGTANNEYGIYATLIVNSGTITATGAATGEEKNGIGICALIAQNITINGGTVTAIGTATGTNNIGIGISGEDMAVNGGTIIATGTGTGTGDGINFNNKITISGGTVTANGKSDNSNDEQGIMARFIVMTGGTLSAKGNPAVLALAITADGAALTNGTADNGSFVSGTTKTLTQTDPTQPVKISFTKSVTFDARNGEPNASAEIKDGMSTITMPADPTWGNYTFAGWYTDKDGKGAAFTNKNLTDSVTVYAKWTKDGKSVRTEPLDLTGGTDLSGDGYVWNNTTKILTLDGAFIDCSGNTAVTTDSFGIKLPDEAKIVLAPNSVNTVNAGDTSGTSTSNGIYFVGNEDIRTSSSISGKGTLNVAAGASAADGASFGILCTEATLSFSDATVYASSTKSNMGGGIGAYLDVQSGTIIATGTGTSAGFGINTPGMTMSGGTVKATGNALPEGMSCGIVAATLDMTGGTLSTSGTTAAVMLAESPITAAGATVTNGTADNEGGKFVSGTTKTLTQTDPTQPVKISFTKSVTFDARNGEPNASAEIKDGMSTITMPANPTWGNYTFAGWYTDKDGKGTAFANKNLTDSVTVYAKWTKDGKSVRTEPLDLTGGTDLSGDGYVWNNTTKTLTLSGMTLNSAKLDHNSDAVGINFPEADCTIILVDGTENTVDVSTAKNTSSSYGIYTDFKLTIKTSGKGTPGKLNAIAGNTTNPSVGIYAGGGIVIESGNITATAGDSTSDNSIGISTNVSDIHIKGGTVNATAGKSTADSDSGAVSIGMFGRNVQIDDGTVTATGNEAPLSAGIAGANKVKLNGGVINAKGKTAAVVATTTDGVVIDDITNVKVNDTQAKVGAKTISEMSSSTLIDDKNAIVTDAAIKFKPSYTGTNPLAPNAPKATKTSNSITLPTQTIAGETVEYGIENPDGSIAWQVSPTFSELNPDTRYKFYARVKANDNHKAGTPSDATEIKTKKAPTSVSGSVKDNTNAPVSGATVTLTPSDSPLTTTTDTNGNYIIRNVPEGVYSLVITTDTDPVITITETVTVDGTPVAVKNIKLLAGAKNTVVESTPGTPKISAGDVNELLNNTNIDATLTNPEKTLVETKGGSVEIKVKADVKTGEQVAADKSQIETIAGNQKIDLLLDFSVLKTVKDSRGNTVTDGEKITQLANLIEIHLPIPADLQGKTELSLYRIHNGKAEKLTTSADSNGEHYTIDGSGEFMTLYLKNFSTYALGYNVFTVTVSDGGTGASGNDKYASGETVTINAGSKSGYSFNGWTVTPNTVVLANASNASTTFIMPATPVTVTASWTFTGGGSTGGDGSSTTTYPNTVNKPQNGTVTMNPASPSKGQTVTITTKPDAEYVVDTIIVKDTDGKTITVTKNGENSYTFVQPGSKTTVEVTYKKAGTKTFTDVTANDWFYNAVMEATGNGWFSGISATTFDPYASTTRGMIASVLQRVDGTSSATTASFSDVAADAYYASGVAWAQENNIVVGYGNGNYGPNDNITREQLAAILYRYAGYKGYDVSKKATLDSFTDGKSVSGYAKEAMSWAVGNGLISGRGDNILAPTATATRAEVAVILVRFDELFIK